MSGPSDPSSPPSAGDEHDSALGAEEEARLRVALLAAYSPTAIAEARHEQRTPVVAADVYEVERRQHQRGFTAGALCLPRLCFGRTRKLSDGQLLSL